MNFILLSIVRESHFLVFLGAPAGQTTECNVFAILALALFFLKPEAPPIFTFSQWALGGSGKKKQRRTQEAGGGFQVSVVMTPVGQSAPANRKAAGGEKTPPAPHLRRHSAPEVGVGGSGLHHGRHDGLVLAHQLPQHAAVRQQVVTVAHLTGTERRRAHCWQACTYTCKCKTKCCVTR